MVNVFLSVILLFLLTPLDFSFAQSHGSGASKIYSGYLHQSNVRDHGSLWQALFGKRSTKPNEDLRDRQCSIEFKGPVSFSQQLVSEVPDKLTYFITFKNAAFEKFIIKIYTNDEEEYSIDPDADGKQVGANDEHRLFDPYLIYLILGRDINHLEIVSSSGDNKDKYVLDKLEIRNND